MLRRADRATELLSNPLLNESIAALEADLIGQLRMTSLSDVQSHTRLAMAFQVTTAVTRHLHHIIHDGEVAAGSIQLRGMRID